MTKEQIMSRIEGLQRTRKYADEIEWQVLTDEISHLFERYNELDKEEEQAGQKRR